ncbi:hypothetical protein QIA41_05280 (plasmid) [Borreliella sinica]|uniref:hypothetical protein n=1 Tax=Borreliella sinica TaxID=87162 RepID=UPI003AF032A0
MMKKMLIICYVFVLIISCKNYASGEDLKEQAKEIKQGVEQKVRGFLEAKKEELTEGLKSLGSEASSKVKEELMQADGPQGQLQEQVAQGVDEDLKLKEEIEGKIKGFRKKIDKSDDKTTLGTYYEYEEEIKKLKKELEEKLKEKKEDKEKLEKELNDLDKTLKEKIEKRKKALEEAKSKFEKYKEQVESANGVTDGARVKEQGKIGQEAWRCAQKLGVNGGYSINDGTDTDKFAKKVIDGALKKIEEELKDTEEKKEERKK